jgi:N-acetylglucosamine-6-sulfatase
VGRRAKTFGVLVVAALVVGGSGAAVSRRSAAAPPPKRPNVLVFETDDQTSQSMFMMRKVQELIGAQGVTFDNSFVSLSVCCPSRTAFLTGQYAHNSGVVSNDPPGGGFGVFEAKHAYNNLAVWLQRAGYWTSLVGKYLNGYSKSAGLAVPPGWNDWHALVNLAYSRRWVMNEDGAITGRHFEYQTDALGRIAIDSLRRRPNGRPFFLWLTFHAPHYGQPIDPGDPSNIPTPSPAEKYRTAFANAALPMPPSFNEADNSDKPGLIRHMPLLSPAEIAGIRSNYQQELESLLSVDDAVAAVMAELSREGILDNTLILYTSDNGFMHGEHRIPNAKGVLYEPSIRVPLLARGPGIPHGLHLQQMVANVNLAPTILEAAHVKPGLVQDARSLWPLFRDPKVWFPEPLLLEGPGTSVSDMQFIGVRTPRYKYVQWHDGEHELYDLATDPYELQNHYGDPAYAGIQRLLASELAELKACVGVTCRPRLAVSLAATCAGKQGSLLSLEGGALGLVSSVAFSRRGTRFSSRREKPFAARIRKAGPVTAQVTLVDGRRATRSVVVRACS